MLPLETLEVPPHDRLLGEQAPKRLGVAVADNLTGHRSAQATTQQREQREPAQIVQRHNEVNAGKNDIPPGRVRTVENPLVSGCYVGGQFALFLNTALLPRWVSYLLLATALVIVAGFVLEYLIDRRTPADGQSRQQWRDHVSSALAASYLGLSTAPYLGKTLRTSNVMPLGEVPRDKQAKIACDLGNRAMLVAVADSNQGSDPYDLADSIASEYPDAVTFVIQDGTVKAAQIGTKARIGQYDKYALIDDYYGLGNPSGATRPWCGSWPCSMTSWPRSTRSPTPTAIHTIRRRRHGGGSQPR